MYFDNLKSMKYSNDIFKILNQSIELSNPHSLSILVSILKI